MSLNSANKIRKIITEARHVCFFGLGVLLYECFGQLVSFVGRTPDFFCDNSNEKWGNEVFNRKCISPEQLEKIGKNTVVIITVRKFEEIQKQLKAMGINHVFVAGFDRGYYALHDIYEVDVISWKDRSSQAVDADFEGRWTLVTGASRGVGRQIARAMAKMGSNIIAHSRSVEHVNELAIECEEFGVNVEPLQANLENTYDVDAMLTRIEREFPTIDIIFNNAAISPSCPLGVWGTGSDVYRECFAVNTIAPIRICQRLIPEMIKRKSGRVINLTTNIQRRTYEMAYACSKAALDKFVYDLFPTLDGTGVMISMVDPGWVKTDAGGPDALYDVESVIPGALLGAVLEDVNGKRISAQEYAGMDLDEAIHKAMWKMYQNKYIQWI